MKIVLVLPPRRLHNTADVLKMLKTVERLVRDGFELEIRDPDGEEAPE